MLATKIGSGVHVCVPHKAHMYTSIIMAELLRNGYLTVFSPEKNVEWLLY